MRGRYTWRETNTHRERQQETHRHIHIHRVCVEGTGSSNGDRLGNHSCLG